MENSTSKIYGYIGSGGFLLLVLMILLLVKLRIPVAVSTPPEGIDVLTEIAPVTSGGGAPSGGSSSSTQEVSGGQMTSNNVVTSPNTNASNQTAPNVNNTKSQGTDWDDIWSSSKSNSTNSSGSGTNGNGGDGPGGDGNGGRGTCKGCTGSGTSLGNGDATRIVKPTINNQDEGTIVVKFEVDPQGNVISVKEYGNKGTVGNLSEDSYRKVREAALKVMFKADPTATGKRTAYISYNLIPH